MGAPEPEGFGRKDVDDALHFAPDAHVQDVFALNTIYVTGEDLRTFIGENLERAVYTGVVHACGQVCHVAVIVAQV